MRRTRLGVEPLESRVVPDATFYKLFTTQHVDLGFDFVGGAWDVSSEFNGGGGAVVNYRPDQTLHYVHPGARVNRPAGGQWDFLGVAAGQPVYVLPQSQNPALLYLGAATEETPAGTFAAYTETDPRVFTGGAFPWLTVRLAAVRGPGHFSVWQNAGLGQPPVVWVSTAENGIDPTDKLILLEGGHAHYNWAFSAPGFYEIDLRASATLAATGQVSQSPVHTFYFVVDDALKVTSVTPTGTGFLARFNRPIDPSTLNLYDAAGGTLGAADVTLVGATTGPVRGSLVVPTAMIPNQTTGVPERTKALNAVEFVATGGPLAPDTYTVTLRGETAAWASNTAFRTTPAPNNTSVLHGNGTTAGTSHVTQFTVAGSTARVVSVPDFARGFGQAVNVPATGAGIPVTIDDAAGVSRVTFDLVYDPALLTVTAAARGPGVPAAFAVTLDATVAGRARVTLDGGTNTLPAGPLTLVTLTAAVPATAPYADKHVLRLADLQLNGGGLPARANHGVHVAGFVGDATGDRSYSGLDAALIAQVAGGQGTGFVAFRNADPVLVGDTSADGSLAAADAVLVAEKVVGRNVPQIPDLPAVTPPPAGGPDPRLFFPTNLAGPPGSAVAVPVRIEVTEAGGVAFQAADYAISFDPARFTVSNPRTAGTLLAGFAVVAEIDDATGVARVCTYSADPVALANGVIGDVLRLDFAVKAGAPAGASPLNLRNSSGPTRTALNEGRLTLAPAPTDGANDADVDGTFTVTAPPAVAEFRVNDGAAQRSRVTSLRVTFDAAVPGLTAANFQLAGFAGTLAVTPNGASTVYTLTFAGAGTEFGSLADGRYTLNVVGVPGLTGPSSFAFHRLFGDSDGNAVVNSDDFDQFGNVFGLASFIFDYDGNGVVNSDDFDQFGNRFGLTI
jgi:surface-anchored protein